MSMFGIVVSGRLVQTDFQQVDTNKFLITIPSADSINHVVVFMTGTQPLPSDMGAAVHFSWPDPHAPPAWRYLGQLNNEKPSAIFKITNLKLDSPGSYLGFGFEQAAVSHVAQIGISIEPLIQLNMQMPDINNVMICNGDKTYPAGACNPFAAFITKSAENLFNYVASFSRQIPGGGNEQFVPLACIKNWYESYSRRLQLNPNFWRD